MAAGWFFADTERWHDPDRPTLVAYRHAIWLRWMAQILAAGGTFRDEETLGAQYVVRVTGVPAALLTQIAGDPGVDRVPADLLDDPLSTLTNQQKNALRSKLAELGYATTEINEAFPGDLGQYTVRQVLRFALRRRRRPRYDSASDAIVWDGPEETPLDPSRLEAV
jgi:hypothetical protein